MHPAESYMKFHVLQLIVKIEQTLLVLNGYVRGICGLVNPCYTIGHVRPSPEIATLFFPLPSLAPPN